MSTKIGIRQHGPVMVARVRLPDGRCFEGRCHLDASPELGWFGSSAVRKVHNVATKGPIGKAHKAVQQAVAKYIPIAKPFIAIHNKLASPVHKLLEGKKLRTAATAKAIAVTTSKIADPTKKAVVQKALATAAKVDEQKRDLATKAALMQAATKAKAALTKPTPGVYLVKRPDGRTISVPASKVH